MAMTIAPRRPALRCARPAEVRQIWPPRYVDYRIDGVWRLGQLLASRLTPAGFHFLIRTLSGPTLEEREPRWLDATDVRQRS